MAKTTSLQTVSLNDLNLSAEGGEARLYLIDRHGDRWCRIEAVHYGETGKAVYTFTFGSELKTAERREIRYELSGDGLPTGKIASTAIAKLESQQGKTLRQESPTYRSYFSTREIAKCSKAASH